MTNDDIKKLAEALQHRENAKDSKVQINKVLRNKSCATIIREFKHLMLSLIHIWCKFLIINILFSFRVKIAAFIFFP